MMSSLRSALNRFPRLKRWLRSLVHSWSLSSRIPSRYIQINGEEAERESGRLRGAWQSHDLPVRQRELVDNQLAALRRGESVDVFDVMTLALRSLPSEVRGMSVLEIGCSSGFYSEVFEISGLAVNYAGCDYSEAFVELARKKYPMLRFDVEDATALKYGDHAFDIVVSGCCLLHIPEYEAAVAETARVAHRYAIFHRTPVVLGQPNLYYRKQAYGVEMVEIHFNEPHFLDLLIRQGLELIATYTLSESMRGGIGSAIRTYVCKKTKS
jgi:SAM-dependent methyltransferase